MSDRLTAAKQTAQRIQALIEEHRDDITQTLCHVETYRTARMEMDWTIHGLSKIDRVLEAVRGREPIGQVSVYMPFNVPVYTFYLYVIAPMLVGNRVFVHQSSDTGWVFEPILEQIGHSFEGRIEVPPVSREQFTEEYALKSDGILVAGDWARGQQFVQRAPRSSVVMYQGGGLNKLVVTPEADLDRAVDAAFRARLFNAGQDCCSTECFYVHRDVIDAFSKRLVERVRDAHVGSNTDEETDIGPLTRPLQAQDLIERLSREAGAEVLLQGRVEGSGFYPGIYRLPRTSELFKAEKFCGLFTLTEYTSPQELYEHLATVETRMILAVFGNPGPLGDLKARYGHFLHDTIIYDVEQPNAAFGGYGRATFVRRPHRDAIDDGPVYIPLECTAPR